MSIKYSMKSNWFKLVILGIIVVIGIFSFNWYEWRPTNIRKYCYEASYGKNQLNVSAFGEEAVKEQQQQLENEYNVCLHKEGLR